MAAFLGSCNMPIVPGYTVRRARPSGLTIEMTDDRDIRIVKNRIVDCGCVR
jgi:hypothetical protein